jgi:hypothetical protein
MMHQARVSAVLALGCLFLAAPVAAADSKLPVLRHLVYSVVVGASGTTEARLEGSALGSVYGSNSANLGEPGKEQQSTSVQERGQLTADVVAVTNDGGLVIDVSEAAGHRSGPVTRVGVQADGSLVYPPEAVLTDEEMELLRLMSRGIANPPARDIGTTWTFDSSNTSATYQTHFRVTGQPAPDQLQLDVNAAFSSKGVHNIEGATSGKVTYDFQHVVPLRATLDKHMSGSIFGKDSNARVSIDLALVQDSFQPSLTSAK